MDEDMKRVEEVIGQAKCIQMGYAGKWIAEIKRYPKVYIFGAGQHGINWYHILKCYGIDVMGFFDNDRDKWGKEVVDHILCDSLEAYREEVGNTAIAIVIAVRDYQGIYEQLVRLRPEWKLFVGTANIIGFRINYDSIGHESRIEEIGEKMAGVMGICSDGLSKEICLQTLRKWLVNEEEEISYQGGSYFFTEEMPLSKEEYLVDGGAFDGDTIKNFEKAVSGQYGRIYAFEMDKRNFECLKNMGDNPKIELYQIGLSDKKGTMYYRSNYASSHLEGGGEEICEVDCLDNILQGRKVTLIKMDIEGSEMKALHGAEQLIKSQKPKLAICIYHSLDDFLDIPVYIKSLNPEYRIMIRHHSMDEYETVCYAF